MKKHVYERIGRLMEQNKQLQEQFDQVTGGQVVQRLLGLEASEKDLREKLLAEKKARRDLLKDVEWLEQENNRLQRKSDRFNAVHNELKVERYSNWNLENQLEAARQEIKQLHKNQSKDYLKVI